MADYLFVRQTDGFTCGPTVAMVASAALDPTYGAGIGDPGDEQHAIHKAANFLWPRKLGTTPWAVAKVISRHARALGVKYRWRYFNHDLADVIAAVEGGWPVAMLIGSGIPRHWILLIGHSDGVFTCFNPARGAQVEVPVADVQNRNLGVLGFPRAFAMVLPGRAV